MPVQLVGTNGYFTRMGVFGGEYNRVANQYGSALTEGFQSIWSQFGSSNQPAVENLPSAVTSYRNTGAQYQSVLQSDANTAALLQVNNDTPLNPFTVQQAIKIVVYQMEASGNTINRPTLGAVVTPLVGNTGNAMIAVSMTNIYGDPLDTTFNETFLLTATQSGTGFQGSIQAVGELAVPINSHTWPAGSGANASIPILDPATTGLVTDGGFSGWGGTGNNFPTSWDIINGDAGVTVFKAAGGGVRSGTDAAQITSDGAQATQLGQTVSIQGNAVYAVTFQAKINTLSPTGTFRICLTDGDGNVLSSDAGTPLEYTRNLNGQIGTNYTQFTAFFSTPIQLPATTRLFVGMSAAAPAGRIILIDLVNATGATQLYGASGTGSAGPWAAAFASDVPIATGDGWTIKFTNSLSTRSFVWTAERLYSMRSSGLYYPSSVTPTIPDTLVTH